MILDKVHIILASGSPRRKQLIQEMGLKFTQKVKSIDESFPKEMDVYEVAEHLSKKKSSAFSANKLKKNEVVLTADTVVIASNKILGKPQNDEAAFQMIKGLSGSTHHVVTGVTLKSKQKTISFSSKTKVKFRALEDTEIDYYIKTFQPHDKAAAYGIQEWIGQIGIERIEGCFYTVMGLPTSMIWDKLKNEIYHQI